MTLPTRDEVAAILRYDRDTGDFFWLVKRGSRGIAGRKAGSIDGKRYIRIRIDGVDYRAHRLAWLLEYGEWPTDQLDHIDLDRKNNAILNLRQANNSLNNFNRETQSNNTSGVTGVRFDRFRSKWKAEIKKDGKMKYLGRFATKEEAAAVRAKAAVQYFGEFSRVRY